MTTGIDYPMTGRERVRRMFERRDHDRVPRHDIYWAETIQRWQGEGLDGDVGAVLQMLGSDFHPIPAGGPDPTCRSSGSRRMS